MLFKYTTLKDIDMVKQRFQHQSVEKSDRSISGKHSGRTSCMYTTVAFATVLLLQVILYIGINLRDVKSPEATSSGGYLGAIIAALVSIAVFFYLVIQHLLRVESARTSKSLYHLR